MGARRESAEKGLALAIISSMTLGNPLKLLFAGGNPISPAHSAAAWLFTVAFLSSGAIFGSQWAIARCKLSTHDLNFTMLRSAARSGSSLARCDGAGAGSE